MENRISYEMAQFINLKLNYPVVDNINKTGYYHKRTKSFISFGRTGRCHPDQLYGAPSPEILRNWILKNKHVFSTVTTGHLTNNAQTFEIVSEIYSSDWMLLDKKVVGFDVNNYEDVIKSSLWHLIDFL